MSNTVISGIGFKNNSIIELFHLLIKLYSCNIHRKYHLLDSEKIKIIRTFMDRLFVVWLWILGGGRGREKVGDFGVFVDLLLLYSMNSYFLLGVQHCGAAASRWMLVPRHGDMGPAGHDSCSHSPP